MNSELGTVGQLIDALSQVSSQAFRLWHDGAPTDKAEGLDPAVAEALHAELEGADTPVCRPSGAGGAVGGVNLSVAGRAHLLLTWPDNRETGADVRQQGVLDVLRCVRQLVDERDASAAESRQLVEELNNTYEDLHLFSRIVTQIRSLHYSEQMLRTLLEETREAMRVELAAAVLLKQREATIMAACPDLGTLLDEPASFLRDLLDELRRSAPEFEGNCHIVNDSSEHRAFSALHAQPFRALAVSIRNGDRDYGWLLLVSFDMKEVFRRGEYRLLSTMAEQVALVLANTDLYRDLELFAINLVKSFITAIEAKDPYTKGHSERVSRLSEQVGASMPLDEGQRRALKWAAVLHDVGKIGTPEAILNKPGRLSDDEYETIQGHPAKGAQILSPITQLADALPGIRHHHERYDGKGYPDGLAAGDIPVLARIIAVADTYDAITSDRAYRKGRSHIDAMRIILESAGSQLDPEAVDVFARVVEEGRQGASFKADAMRSETTFADGPQTEEACS